MVIKWPFKLLYGVLSHLYLYPFHPNVQARNVHSRHNRVIRIDVGRFSFIIHVTSRVGTVNFPFCHPRPRLSQGSFIYYVSTSCYQPKNFHKFLNLFFSSLTTKSLKLQNETFVKIFFSSLITKSLKLTTARKFRQNVMLKKKLFCFDKKNPVFVKSLEVKLCFLL